MQKLSQLKYHVVGGDFAVDRIFAKHAEKAKGVQHADIVVFTGGADVSPYLYNDKVHPKTHCTPRRDEIEFGFFRAAKDKLKVGICRGGQLLNVLNGGWMWQDVDNHALSGTHMLSYKYFSTTANCEILRRVPVTSTHHQMMMVNKKARPQIWGVADETTFKESGTRLDMGVGAQVRMTAPKGHNSDVEIVWYPYTKSLCFQPHPEYNHKDTRELFFECIDRALEQVAAA